MIDYLRRILHSVAEVICHMCQHFLKYLFSTVHSEGLFLFGRVLVGLLQCCHHFSRNELPPCERHDIAARLNSQNGTPPISYGRLGIKKHESFEPSTVHPNWPSSYPPLKAFPPYGRPFSPLPLPPQLLFLRPFLKDLFLPLPHRASSRAAAGPHTRRHSPNE